jgi:hypothetical protein
MGERFANLATDRDYNHLANHVNIELFHRCRCNLLAQEDFLHNPSTCYPIVKSFRSQAIPSTFSDREMLPN